MVLNLILAFVTTTAPALESRPQSAARLTPSAVEIQLSCKVNEARSLSDCVVLNPSDENVSFQEAALQMAKFMTVPSGPQGAGPAPGWEITVPIRFPVQ
jgi:TonB family protein